MILALILFTKSLSLGSSTSASPSPVLEDTKNLSVSVASMLGAKVTCVSSLSAANVAVSSCEDAADGNAVSATLVTPGSLVLYGYYQKLNTSME